MAMADSTVGKVEQYKSRLKAEAEELILTGFPKKILELNALLEKPPFLNMRLTDVHQKLNIPVPDPIIFNNVEPPNIPIKRHKYDSTSTTDSSGTKILILPDGEVLCNPRLRDLIVIVKPHIRQLVEDANVLKMWISFMIPKIEDGNNFGVSIQEETLGEIQSVETEAASFFDQISRYYISRGKLISKVAKYPHVQDYRLAVQEMDEKEYFSLWLVMCEIRNRYCTLHDIVLKNLEKIKKPRTSNAENLY